MGVKSAKKVVDVEKIYYEFKNQEFKKLVNNFDRYGFKTSWKSRNILKRLYMTQIQYIIHYITNEEEAKEFNFAYESYSDSTGTTIC